VNEPEKCTSGESAPKEGQEGGDENGEPNGNAATEVSAVAHRVVVVEELVSLARGERSSEIRQRGVSTSPGR